MDSLDKIILALAPVFAAGFAVQQLLEILTSFFDLDSKQFFQKFKKPILGLVALLLGLALANQLDKGVLQILQGSTTYAWFDKLATALVISVGTEGVNSILKFLKYSKEDKKREAAGQDPKSTPAGGGGAPGLNAAGSVTLNAGAARAATEDALVRLNRQ